MGMQTADKQLIDMHQTVQHLIQTLAQTEARHERAMRRQRWFWSGLGILFVAAFYLTGQFGATAFAQTDRQMQTAPVDQQNAIARRSALKQSLPAEAQDELAQFEQQVEWISQYMQTWDERQAGAVVALMLSRIGQNMNAMPQIHHEMQTMTSLMQGMPVVAAEMQRMSANIAVMTANVGIMSRNIDSTMGRMGRAMPWP
jgi:hypothetical protein